MPVVTQKGARDQVNTACAAYREMIDDVVRCRDVAAGTSRIRNKSMTYLPKGTAEGWDDYRERLNRSVFFNAFARSTEGLTGLVFREDPQFQDVPPSIESDLENVDAEGQHVSVFAKRLFEDALEAGHNGILVDVPHVEGAMSRGAERELGIRPRWRLIRKEDIISWRFVVGVDGSKRLTQIVIREPDLEPVGDFLEQEREYYRVLRLESGGVTWQLYEINDKGKQVEVTQPAYITNITEIPFVPCYGGAKTGFLMSRPPLLDLAYTNITHYQVRSDHLWALHMASLPIGVITGINPDAAIKIGVNSWLKLPDPQSDAKYIEHSGSALTATADMQTTLLQEMAVLGLSMLQHESRAAETAEAKRIDKAEQDSALATAARACGDALEQALAFHAQFMRAGDTGGTVTMNRDYEALTLSDAEITAYSNLVGMGQLSLETMWSVLLEGGKLPEGFDAEEEMRRVMEQGLIAPTSEDV